MPIEILHIGAGLRGRSWLDFVAAHPETTTAGCVEPDPASREQVAGSLPADRLFDDVDRALDTVKADAVLIASPSLLHAEHAQKALARGLAVLVEKPFATTIEEAKEVVRAGQEAGRPVVVGEQFRYVPAERTVRRLVLSGDIGTPFCATVSDRRRMPAATQGAWTATMEYPQLQEIAVHHFDSVRAFFDKKPVAITARVWNPPGSDYAHGACTEALIELEDGLHVQYVGTLVSHKFAYKAWLEGDGGVLWTDRKRVFRRRAGAKFFLPVRKDPVPRGDADPYPREGTTSLLDSLVAAVREGRRAETVADDNLWTIAMVEAAKRSDRERRTIAIEDVLG